MDDRRSLSRIGEGITSCLDIPELQHLPSLSALCLHGNNISRIEGLQALVSLQDLNLSSNRITSVSNLGTLTSLTSLNLASNKLTHLQGFDLLPNLTHLNLSYNGITSLAGLAALTGSQCKLRVLDVRHNQLPNLHALAVLAGCMCLRELSIAGNPACAAPNHQQMLLQVLPHVAKLDGVSSAEVMVRPPDPGSARQYAAEQLQLFDQQMLGMPSPPQQQQRQQQGGARTTPHIDATLASFHQKQGSPGRGQDPRERFSSSPTHTQSQQQAQQPSSSGRQAVNWQHHGSRHARSGGDGGTGSRGEASGRSRNGSGTETDPPRDGSLRFRVYVADAAVQTPEHLGLQAKLQEESKLLREQLVQLTDELERRNVLEEQAHQDMQDAVLEAQEEAHKHVEEGYREASHAVARALQELEAARVQGQQAQDQVKVHIKLEEEAKAQCAALQRDITRLEDELRRARDQAGSDQRKASASLEEERKRCMDSEYKLSQRAHALEQQLQARGAELAAAAAAAAAAERKLAVLEATLQQSGESIVSLTGKMAQGMADANVQIDALRAKLSGAEQQVAEQLRKEAEARAEINMLMSSLTLQKQAHQQELEARERAAQDQLAAALERERGAGEERGKASVLMRAEKDKGALQEQLTYLKMQLQYALKESEKEAAHLSEQVSQGQAEVQELQAALQAAGAKNKEHEGLVADMSHVLQQQKSHIQVLQKERDGLVQQLRACAPDRFERLLAENQALRRANAELDVLREQVLHHKRAWQEAERQHMEVQAGQTHKVEDIQGQVAKLEAALSAAKDEAKAASQRTQGVQQQLAAAEDALKIKRAMLDSANDTIEQLKAELGDMQGELEDTRRMAEDLDGQLRGAQEQDATEKANLRSEIEAGESALEQLSGSVSEAQGKQREAEAKLKAVQDALAEKEAMISYVNEEVDRVKGMFEQREGRLRDERDLARHQTELATLERDAAEARVKELRQELDVLRKELEAAHVEARASREAAGSAESQALQAERRLAEVEDEMRQLLLVVERQKATSANKMKQLASILQDL